MLSEKTRPDLSSEFPVCVKMSLCPVVVEFLNIFKCRYFGLDFVCWQCEIFQLFIRPDKKQLRRRVQTTHVPASETDFVP